MRPSNAEIDKQLTEGDDARILPDDMPDFYCCAECGNTVQEDAVRFVGESRTPFCRRCFHVLTG